jgi:cytochrome b561
MESRRQRNQRLRKILSRVKHGALIILFILVPFAGAFHPKLRERKNPDDKEIGSAK